MPIEINPGLMSALADRTRRRFVQSFAGELRSVDPGASAMNPDELEAALLASVTRAQAEGFTTDDELRTYCVATWTLGPDFPARFPEAARILASGLEPALRASQLRTFLAAIFVALNGGR